LLRKTEGEIVVNLLTETLPISGEISFLSKTNLHWLIDEKISSSAIAEKRQNFVTGAIANSTVSITATKILFPPLF